MLFGAVLHFAIPIIASDPAIRTLAIGPAVAATAGLLGWLVARALAPSTLAANDNHPRLAPLPARR